ncbi:MAG TPA: sigma factor-like helix-turn-helix DNA-binding protein [Amycolatopsis sp.]|uniref:sigma factor-like helix-turn-helix DNA-binding protein n=1 Tax=Amycolatopsis sp. TaxID=37632 RepID=UPI002B4A5DF9|nr:sigma factor-like helix-turn-helix DNA-binding protein [Amycolatopsis sp.]HKS46610.1 sigma factor-like helix-turn-helix DNA-binding protein [Amycolatopsis sp.]
MPIPFEHDSNPDYVVDRALGAELVRKAVSMLKERETEVLRLRFGFDGGDDRTLGKIGEHFSFTSESARQIESKAKEKPAAKLAQVGLVADGVEPAPPRSARPADRPSCEGRPRRPGRVVMNSPRDSGWRSGSGPPATTATTALSPTC